MNHEKTKLAVIFPGIGYHCDKPLLHYARRVFTEAGYKVVCVPYKESTFENNKVTSKGVMRAYQICVRALNKLEWEQYDDIVFIGKSVGTVLDEMTAQSLDKRISSTIRYLQLTPLEQTFPYMQGQKVWAASGTKDPVISVERLKELAQQYQVEMHYFEDANHSLEVRNHPLKSIEILKEIVGVMLDFAK